MDKTNALHDIEAMREQYAEMQLKCSDEQEKYDSMKEGDREREKQLKRLETLKEKYSEVKKEYSLSIFKYFSTIKPDLIVRKTGELVTWNSIFPESIVSPSDDQVRSIIALIEEDGGKYRLQNSWKS